MTQTSKRQHTADRCPSPPHAAHAVKADAPDAPEPVVRHPDAEIKAAARWVMAAPAARAPLPGAAALYGAGWAANYWHLPWWGALTATAVGTITAYATTLNRSGDGWRTWGNTAAAATAGAWLTAADVLGPAAGPSGLLSWVFAGAFGAGYGLHLLGLRERGPKRLKGAVPRIDWEAYFPDWGMDGATVISSSATRLGERALIATRGTGKRASQFLGGALAERIAEDFDTKKSRVIVREGEKAGQIEISVRLVDPWASPILHPLLDDEPEIELPDVADARQPLIIGQDPETGEPLEFVAWDEDGAAHWLIVAIKGGGKTVLLNNILERLTAASNAHVMGIDVSKAKDLRRWRDSGAIKLTACGPAERARAVAILELVASGVAHRAEHNHDAVFEPRHGHPLVVVVIDEIDALVSPGDILAQRAVTAIKTITSKGRSESVGLVIVGQRGTAAWMGGADIRANLDRQALLKQARKSEQTNALGDAGAELPDMSKYGEGHAGVVALTNMGAVTGIGRSFMLKNLDDVERIGTGREPSPFEPDLVEFWGEAYDKLMAGELPETAPTPAAAEAGGSAVVSTPADRASERARIKASLTLVQSPPPELVEKLRDHAQARREMFEAVERPATSTVPAQQRAQILGLIGREGGAAMSEITTAIRYSESQTLRWMRDLRDLGLAEVRGKGPATRWHTPEDDAESRPESLHGIAP